MHAMCFATRLADGIAFVLPQICSRTTNCVAHSVNSASPASGCHRRAPAGRRGGVVEPVWTSTNPSTQPPPSRAARSGALHPFVALGASSLFPYFWCADRFVPCGFFSLFNPSTPSSLPPFLHRTPPRAVFLPAAWPWPLLSAVASPPAASSASLAATHGPSFSPWSPPTWLWERARQRRRRHRSSSPPSSTAAAALRLTRLSRRPCATATATTRPPSTWMWLRRARPTRSPTCGVTGCVRGWRWRTCRRRWGCTWRRVLVAVTTRCLC